jgi:hypothetical protein
MRKMGVPEIAVQRQMRLDALAVAAAAAAPPDPSAFLASIRNGEFKLRKADPAAGASKPEPPVAAAAGPFQPPSLAQLLRARSALRKTPNPKA